MSRVADIIPHNPPGVFPPYSGYAHAVEVPPGARTLYISGLNGYEWTAQPCLQISAETRTFASSPCGSAPQRARRASSFMRHIAHIDAGPMPSNRRAHADFGGP